MGYYSDVQIICDKDTYYKIDRVFSKYDNLYTSFFFRPTEVSVNGHGEYKIWFDAVKWYRGDKWIDDITDILHALDDTDDGFALLIINGEEFGDVFWEAYGREKLVPGDYDVEVVVNVRGFNGIPIIKNQLSSY